MVAFNDRELWLENVSGEGNKTDGVESKAPLSMLLFIYVHPFARQQWGRDSPIGILVAGCNRLHRRGLGVEGHVSHRALNSKDTFSNFVNESTRLLKVVLIKSKVCIFIAFKRFLSSDPQKQCPETAAQTKEIDANPLWAELHRMFRLKLHYRGPENT
jgi:hypothetical protein